MSLSQHLPFSSVEQYIHRLRKIKPQNRIHNLFQRTLHTVPLLLFSLFFFLQPVTKSESNPSLALEARHLPHSQPSFAYFPSLDFFSGYFNRTSLAGFLRRWNAKQKKSRIKQLSGSLHVTVAMDETLLCLTKSRRFEHSLVVGRFFVCVFVQNVALELEEDDVPARWKSRELLQVSQTVDVIWLFTVVEPLSSEFQYHVSWSDSGSIPTVDCTFLVCWSTGFFSVHY